MKRAVLLLAALGLAGCPLPQPLPDYPAGTITPPRILQDQLLEDGAVTLVPAGCTTVTPEYTLSAGVVDSNTIEGIEARWFVNYANQDPWSTVHQSNQILPNPDSTNLVRGVPEFVFRPYTYPPPMGTTPVPGPPYNQDRVLHVVELVVSNGFDPSAVGTNANRAPKPGFETQYHRWVFLNTAEVDCSKLLP